MERVLTEYAEFLTTDEDIGWENGCRIYGPLLHIDICGGKLWIQNDGTEDGIALGLLAADVPKERIVLAFHHPSRWKDTEFAAG